jgi:N-methylhydantoinase A
MVDMHTIGAGGGSVARVDAGGLLQVGPESAGAAPGPACYGRGGNEATVTDANLLLGRLLPDAFLGGEMVLDVAAAETAVGAIAQRLQLGLHEAAEGIVRIANEHMARALRVMSVQRGQDPRQMTLCCFGGAGGLHVCALAEALGMHQAMVPVHGGVLSALGMLTAPRGRQLSHSLQGALLQIPPQTIEQAFAELRSQAERSLALEGLSADKLQASPSLDLRYLGQAHTLTLPWQGSPDEEAFHLAHQQRYGHRLDLPVELVTLRLRLQGLEPDLPLGHLTQASAQVETQHLAIHGFPEGVAVWPREALVVAQQIDGPALITEQVSTTWIAPGWRCVVDPHGNLILNQR